MAANANGFLATLGAVDTGEAAQLLTASSDIALIVDSGGRIRDCAFQGRGALAAAAADWPGRLWIETVAADSRPKVEALIREAHSATQPTRREINHLLKDGGDTPVRYAAMGLRAEGAVLALGQDIGGLADLQRRLVRAQGEVDREHARIRGAEKRFRAVFNLTTEAILLAAPGGRIMEANAAAERLLRGAPRTLDSLFEGEARNRVGGLIAALAAGGAPDEIEAMVAGARFRIHGSLFQRDADALVVVRLTRCGAAPDPIAPAGAPGIEAVLRDLPDGFAMIDGAGVLRDANPAFAGIVGAASVAALRGRPFDDWFERPGVDFPALMATLRDTGLIRRFPTRMRAVDDETVAVEIAAASARAADPPLFGFVIRPAAIAQADAADGAVLARSGGELAGLIGQVPLKDLVREAADAIERLSIDSALQLTGGNRASAAKLLGLSRQSLYAKLRRYGYIDGAEDDAL